MVKIGEVRWPFGPSGTSSFFLVIVFLTLIFSLLLDIYNGGRSLFTMFSFYYNILYHICQTGRRAKFPRRQLNLPTNIFCEFALTTGVFGPKFWQSDLLGLYNFLRREKKVFCRFAASQQHMGLLKRQFSLLLEKKQFFLLFKISFYWIRILCPKKILKILKKNFKKNGTGRQEAVFLYYNILYIICQAGHFIQRDSAYRGNRSAILALRESAAHITDCQKWQKNCICGVQSGKPAFATLRGRSVNVDTFTI